MLGVRKVRAFRTPLWDIIRGWRRHCGWSLSLREARERLSVYNSEVGLPCTEVVFNRDVTVVLQLLR